MYLIKYLIMSNLSYFFQHKTYTTVFSRRRAIQLYVFLMIKIKFKNILNILTEFTKITHPYTLTDNG